MAELEIRHSIPTGLQILLSDLDFLGQVKRNTKPCTNDRVIVDANSWSGAFYRFFKGENRTNVVSKIEQIVSQTVDAIEAHKNSDHIKIIINYFANARNGVYSLLTTTYKDDPDIKAKLSVQIDIMDLQLDRFRHLIKGYRREEVSPSEKEDFPGLNSNEIDLTDNSPPDNKIKIKRSRVKGKEVKNE